MENGELFRVEHDTMGEVRVPADHLWGAQTQRSFQNFAIGTETMPEGIIRAFALLKKAAALANRDSGKLDEARCGLITAACDQILAGRWPGEFPLKVWQTGSGTQSNMNVNEVIAHLCARLDPALPVHPNDHVNMSQSSNDTFPTALHVAAALAIREQVLPALGRLRDTLGRLEAENWEVVKIGRTHLQDAVPIRFGQEISGWRAMAEECAGMLKCPVYMDPADRGTLENAGYFCTMFGFNTPQTDVRTEDIHDGDRIRFGNTEFEVLSTPGHTPGGVCFYDAADKVLFSGDTLFAGSIGRTDHPGGDYDRLMEGIFSKLMVLDGDVDVIPGHGPHTTVSDERTRNPFLQPFNEPYTDEDSNS